MSKKNMFGAYSVAALALLVSGSAFAQWAVIEYSPSTGNWGRAQCSDSLGDAVNTAYSYCAQNGATDCVQTSYSEGGYVSLARSASNSSQYAWSGDHSANAENSSLAACATKTGASDCETVATGYAYNCN